MLLPRRTRPLVFRPRLSWFVCLGVWWTGFILLGCILFRSAALPADGSVSSPRGMLATVQPLATEAGLAAFRDGGNAVDAAIAAALTLGVVDSHNSGLGGGCFILIRQPDGQLIAIDGRETAPALATQDMYLRDGRAVPQWSQTGPLAIAVPGALAAHQRALTRAGRLSLRQLLLPAAKLAEQGFPIDPILARNLRETVADIQLFPATKAILLRPDGTPWETGDRLVQTDLAKTYRAIANQGPSWFYQGPLAAEIGHWMSDQGGLIRAEDFARYEAKLREPILTTYRGNTVVGFPPPSSGGIHVAQILNILENFDLGKLYREDPATFTHVIAEAMKLAFADRAYWLGDSDFAPVPKGLLDKAYARQLAQQIDPIKVTPVTKPGYPPEWQTKTFRQHTTHIAAADAEGYWVAITATVNTAFGSKVIVPGTGLVLNNEMDDFSAQPGVPNAFGLVGNLNNAIAPGKRPLSSMSPTLVLRDGRPILTLGAAGGPKIITQVVLGIIHVLDLGWPVEQAVATPRWHHQWRPDRLFFEDTLPQRIQARLAERGHELERLEAAGVMQAIMVNAQGQFIGVHDPRVPGRAAGF